MMQRLLVRLRLFFTFILAATRPVYGGQAVINGVMMKGKEHYAVSVLTKKGVHTKTDKHVSIAKRYKFFGWPFIRGVVTLIEMMVLGYRTLNYSADIAIREEEEEEAKKSGKPVKESKGMGLVMMVGTMLFSLVLAIALFKFLPLLAAKGADKIFTLNTLGFNLIDGVIKLGIFIAYIAIIGTMKDIKDLFRFHGAEHKTINCFEAGKKLSIKNIASFSTVHLRCGTTFMFVVILLSIFVYLFIPKDVPLFINLALRLALLPVVAAISYELQRFGALRYQSGFRFLLAPGLWMQSLTTNEPAPRHIRAGKASLEAVIAAEKK